jgi:Zn-dependent M28 family amino/carboxypeptidase
MTTPVAVGRTPIIRSVAAFAVAAATWLAMTPLARPADASSQASGPEAKALASITGAKIMERDRVLSSDAFEGRSAGTHGEDVTVAYLISQFKALGLEPGNPDGTYIQKVPMTAYLTHPGVTLVTGGKTVTLKAPDDIVGRATVRRKHVVIKDSQIVFVGYGVQAPEYQWDDFKGIDLHGKTMLVLINDPPIPDPADPTKLDPKMFGGMAMTYYGRWTYKYETAAKLGAAAAIIVHETIPAAYPWSVVANSNGGENYSLGHSGPDPAFPPFAGWMTLERTKELLAANGLDFDTLKAQALKRDFKPVLLRTRATFDIQNSWRTLDSRNVVAKIAGRDPTRNKQYIVYSAHWDHFGWDPKLPGGKTDQIYHGAADNGSGVASLLTLAEAFKTLPQATPRSLLFMATTGEERGLLGAAWYARHPLYPLKETVADLNMDVMNALGVTRDMQIVGFGQSELDDLASAAATAQGRVTVPFAHPERGSFYRADHLEFARVGVPALYLGNGMDFIGQPADYGEKKNDEWTANRYHQVRDVIQPDWTFAGGVQDVQVLWTVGDELATGTGFPNWKPGSEFKAKRDKMMAAH